MYALPCSCGHTLAVSPGQAGDHLTCPKCQQRVDIPLLRALRELPRIESDEPVAIPTTGSFATRVAFGFVGLVALIAASFATFALVSAMAITIEYDTEKHMEYDRAMMLQSSPADLVKRWSMATKAPLVQRRPFQYHQDQVKKDTWNQRMVLGYSVAGVALLMAVGLAVADRRKMASAKA